MALSASVHLQCLRRKTVFVCGGTATAIGSGAGAGRGIGSRPSRIASTALRKSGSATPSATSLSPAQLRRYLPIAPQSNLRRSCFSRSSASSRVSEAHGSIFDPMIAISRERDCPRYSLDVTLLVGEVALACGNLRLIAVIAALDAARADAVESTRACNFAPVLSSSKSPARKYSRAPFAPMRIRTHWLHVLPLAD